MQKGAKTIEVILIDFLQDTPKEHAAPKIAGRF